MATLLEWVNDKIRIPEDRKKEHIRKHHLGPPKLDQKLIENFQIGDELHQKNGGSPMMIWKIQVKHAQEMPLDF